MNTECSHEELEVVSSCCGAPAFYGVCGQCRDHTGWEEYCVECGDIINDNAETPSP
jgi:hypothetical protein